MLSVVAGVLLLVHAFVHLRVWVWGGVGGDSSAPHRSWLLGDVRRVSSALAVGAGGLLATAGVGAFAGQDWAALVALAGGATSIALIALVFHRSLLLGLALDAVLIAFAVG